MVSAGANPLIEALSRDLAPAGLALRGGFAPAPADAVPALADGRPVRAVLLVGNVGPALWSAFAPHRDRLADRGEPLNAWIEERIGPIAETVGAHPLYVHDGPPHIPIQRWARRAAPVHESPLRLLIDPDHGLWHAYRAAFCFGHAVALPECSTRPSPCQSCATRPCLGACPVEAFAAGGFDAAACRAHLDRPAGAPCRDGGCLARRACPIGRRQQPPAAAQAFHMAAFRKAAYRRAPRAPRAS